MYVECMLNGVEWMLNVDAFKTATKTLFAFPLKPEPNTTCIHFDGHAVPNNVLCVFLPRGSSGSHVVGRLPSPCWNYSGPARSAERRRQ